uniref:Uncharacterized protein n=1 Tax=Cajanus cajan TaxID=3821 RepID=A0A151TLP6_CAJCA|nr:hypothetical protein KK1_021599 [Cajanus cajan]
MEEDPNPSASKFYNLLRDVDEQLWDGCKKHTKLSAVTQLINLKSEFNFMSKNTSKYMRWHVDGVRQDESIMTHPADADAWKKFDHTHPTFAQEPRNVRLGLCTDGFNPFGNSSTSYSCWPIFLTPYNLPPSMCMKRKVWEKTCMDRYSDQLCKDRDKAIKVANSRNYEDLRAHKPRGMKNEIWNGLIDIWKTPEWQKKFVAGRQNRAAQPEAMVHIEGQEALGITKKLW